MKPNHLILLSIDSLFTRAARSDRRLHSTQPNVRTRKEATETGGGQRAEVNDDEIGQESSVQKVAEHEQDVRLPLEHQHDPHRQPQRPWLGLGLAAHIASRSAPTSTARHARRQPAKPRELTSGPRHVTLLA
mgnify:CR=1 FL=1